MKYFLIAAVLMAFVSCKQAPKSVETEKPTSEMEVVPEDNMVIIGKYGPEMFKSKMDGKKEFLLLDIRTPEEIAENGMIEGAVNLDFYHENFKSKIESMDRKQAVFLYCRSGGRSGEATQMMQELGFYEVYDLEGGYNAWLETYGNQ